MEYKLKRNLRRWGSRLLRLAVILLMGFLICGSLYAGLDPADGLIHPNVTVGGIDVGGMTMERACRELKYASQEVLERSTLLVEFPEENVGLDPRETKASLNCHKAVLDAWLVGRIGNRNHTLWLQPYLRLDRQYIRDVIDRYADKYDTDLTPCRYTLAGDMPDLGIEAQNSTPQTLELTLGLPTSRLDREDAFAQILAVYDAAFAAANTTGYRVPNHFRVVILEPPKKPDLQEIYKEVHIAPVDDAIDLENHSVIPGAWGYRFDVSKARKLVNKAEFGETVSIPMELEEPEIFGDKVYFRDVLGHCETKHTKDENRNHNLRLACASMNGIILQPGETFSYNDTLGQRTKENGYRRAGAYSGWELVQAYGGGICQGSSTLYCATLYADLEIVQRKNHGYKVGYLDAGLDATVNWGGPDFQFRNNTHFPIKIEAEVSDGYVKVSILGTEERDYYVEMETEAQWGDSTIYAKSYKCKYDRKTGEQISRELEAKSKYMR